MELVEMNRNLACTQTLCTAMSTEHFINLNVSEVEGHFSTLRPRASIFRSNAFLREIR